MIPYPTYTKLFFRASTMVGFDENLYDTIDLTGDVNSSKKKLIQGIVRQHGGNMRAQGGDVYKVTWSKEKESQREEAQKEFSQGGLKRDFNHMDMFNTHKHWKLQ
ncbi:MAG: hypothetical protein Q9162_003495 [Coniocarpon cinnabarinum]